MPAEYLFVDTMMPILNPAGVQELIDYGIYGYALSRFAGTWAAIKCVKDNIESTASVDGSLDRAHTVILPRIRDAARRAQHPPRDRHLAQEARLHEHKRAAASAFIRANGLNRTVYSGGRKPKIGIITVGKSYLDVRQALDDLGIDEARADRIGLRLFKVACPWPLDLDHIRDFARGLDLIIVVEEKRSLIEVQVRENLYGTAKRPLVVGKKDERGDWLFPAKGALDPNDIAIAIGERVLKDRTGEDIAQRRAPAQAVPGDARNDIATSPSARPISAPAVRTTARPRCPRARSPMPASAATAWRSGWTARRVGFTQMGGEGANWVGEAPFSTREHVFQNIGDGTYNHSGVLAICASRSRPAPTSPTRSSTTMPSP